MNTTYYLFWCLPAFSVPFVLSKQLISQPLITFRAGLTRLEKVWKWKKSQTASGGRAQVPPMLIHWTEPSSVGCLCLLEMTSSPCWDPHPFLEELLENASSSAACSSFFHWSRSSQLSHLCAPKSLIPCWQSLSASQVPNSKLLWFFYSLS